jgi:hypothetical protein
MTLGNMRELGVRSLDVSCWTCQHHAVLSADRWSDDVAVPTFGPRMVDEPFSSSALIGDCCNPKADPLGSAA